MIKEDQVSGQFYEAHPDRLSARLDQLLTRVPAFSCDQPVSIVIVPHAGHQYSGPVAAYGFEAIRRSQPSYKTVILLGPTHYYTFEGVALWPRGAFRTPLGLIEVDEVFCAHLMENCLHVQAMPRVFERDHVLEVELPFLQKVLKDFKIVPLIMSRSADRLVLEDLATALDKLIGTRRDALLLISSDLSHFHPEPEARRIDEMGLKVIEAMNIEALWDGHQKENLEIDGYKEVMTALLYARKRGLKKVQRLKYATSGDVTHDRKSVVGYAALVIT